MVESVEWPRLPENIGETARLYYDAAITDIKKGKAVWIQLELYNEKSRIVEFYKDRKRKGYVEQAYEDQLCLAYQIPEDPDGAPEIISIDTRVNFDVAKRMVEDRSK